MRIGGRTNALTSWRRPVWYTGAMAKDHLNAVLDGIRAWPREDQEELVEIVRDIEARRTGVYVMSEDERAAVADARTSRILRDEEARVFWKRLGIA